MGEFHEFEAIEAGGILGADLRQRRIMRERAHPDLSFRLRPSVTN
jgi:hypothetical protein